MVQLRIREGSSQRCPLCQEQLAGGPGRTICSGCRTVYHHECFEELGGCSTLGCPRKGLASGAPTPRLAPRPRSGWRRARSRCASSTPTATRSRSTRSRRSWRACSASRCARARAASRG
ncbi:MAG TPA: hypothetical protein DEA08_14415 [Planctomycetes bacterium]|nr:hypothetical protein [Planctomycetota bacterium]